MLYLLTASMCLVMMTATIFSALQQWAEYFAHMMLTFFGLPAKV